MCMTGQSVLFMNTRIHPQRTKKHLSSTAKVCQGAERDPHSSARQSNTRTANRKPRKQTVSEGLGHQAVIHELLVTLLLTISQFVQFRIFSQSVWDKTKKRGLSGLGNPTSTSHNWQLSSPASWTVTVVLSYVRVIQIGAWLPNQAASTICSPSETWKKKKLNTTTTKHCQKFQMKASLLHGPFWKKSIESDMRICCINNTRFGSHCLHSHAEVPVLAKTSRDDEGFARVTNTRRCSVQKSTKSLQL